MATLACRREVVLVHLGVPALWNVLVGLDPLVRVDMEIGQVDNDGLSFDNVDAVEGDVVGDLMGRGDPQTRINAQGLVHAVAQILALAEQVGLGVLLVVEKESRPLLCREGREVKLLGGHRDFTSQFLGHVRILSQVVNRVCYE